jgi:hypothetical protein
MLRSIRLIPVLMVGISMPAIAADLPKSGSFDIETGWKAIGELTQVADKVNFSTGKVWGVSFNTAGSGPLHQGPAVCTYENQGFAGTGVSRGRCAWSDADGDHIFSEYSGKFTPGNGTVGTSTITSGTGKYASIQGGGPFNCKILNAANGQFLCSQHFDYELTSVASGTTTPPATTPTK